MLWNLMLNFSLILSQSSLYSFKILSSLIKKDMFLPPFLKYLMYPFIWGKTMFNNIKRFNNFTSSVTNKMLKAFITMLRYLSDTTIWFTITDINSIGSLDLWNFFLLSLILLNFSVFSFILYIKEKTKTYYFLALLFYTEQILVTFFFGTL